FTGAADGAARCMACPCRSRQIAARSATPAQPVGAAGRRAANAGPPIAATCTSPRAARGDPASAPARRRAALEAREEGKDTGVRALRGHSLFWAPREPVYEHGQTPRAAVLDRIARTGDVTAAWLLTAWLPRKTPVERAARDWRQEVVADLGGLTAAPAPKLALVDAVVSTKIVLDSLDRSRPRGNGCCVPLPGSDPSAMWSWTAMAPDVAALGGTHDGLPALSLLRRLRPRAVARGRHLSSAVGVGLPDVPPADH